MKNLNFIIASLLFLASAFSVSAEETFVGTVRTTMGNPVKGVKAFVNNPKDAVKSDKNGEFKIKDVKPTDLIHIVYKKRLYSFAVNDRQDMMLVAGEDDRLFDRNEYTGETFHGHLVDYKGNPIRGAIVYANDPFDYVKSDKEGTFLIDNIGPTDTIHIKYNGDIHDIAMDGSKGMYIKITRKPMSERDDMVINTGAGYLRLRDYNGPYSKMDAKQLEATGKSSVIDAIKFMPGVNTSFDKNDAGESIKTVMVRNNNIPPLWIIDGMPGVEPDLLDVKEVESVVVLKDGWGWGTRGAGGVIVVTTKGNKW